MWQNMDERMCLRLHEQDMQNMRLALHGGRTKRRAKDAKPAGAKAPGRIATSLATMAISAWATLGLFFRGTH